MFYSVTFENEKIFASADRISKTLNPNREI